MTSTNVLQRLRRRRPANRAILYPKDRYGLSAMATSAGVEQRSAPEAYSWDGERRGTVAFALFQYTFSGSGLLDYEGETLSVTPGQAMLLTIPHRHRYYLPAGGSWRFFYLCLNGSEVLRAVRQAINLKGPVWTFEPEQPALQAAATLCHELIGKQTLTRWEVSARVYGLAMALLAAAEPVRGERGNAPARPKAIRAAVELGRRHFRDPAIGVDALAQAAGLSRYHFGRMFQQVEGIPPGEWLRRQRLNEGVRLLQTSALPIADIARQAGIGDPNYFARAFRKVYGVSPQAFRGSGMF